MTRSAAIVVVLAASFDAGCGPAPPRPASSDVPPVAVATGRAEHVELRSTLEAGGIVRAGSTAVVASRMMAPIADVHVRPGDRVKRGAPLVTLDAREIRANRARASAALESAQEAARAADADVRAADAAVRLARATHERISSLHAKRSATTQELDQAVAGLSAAEAQLGGAERRTAAAGAARDAARASMEAAEIAESYAVLSAPFDGVITDRTADPGSMAIPGAPLLTLEDPRMFRLEVALDEARAGVFVGERAEVRVDDSQAWTAARVSEVARVDPTSHSFLVKIDLPASEAVRSGQFGRARFTGRARPALAVPASAILLRGQLTFVFVIDPDGAARLRAIRAGASTADRTEVLAGLTDGEVVITNPPVSLVDGARVRVEGERPRAVLTPPGDAR